MAGALEAFFRSYYDPLCAVAGRYVECSDGAEDVVQDVFTLLWERPSLWQGCKEPRRYLYVAVRNCALRHRTHDCVVQKVRETLERIGDSVGVSRGPAQPDEDAAANELLAAFRSSVDRLPSRRQEAYAQFWNGRTQAEIADGMGISVRTVETHVGEARKMIRQELAAWI